MCEKSTTNESVDENKNVINYFVKGLSIEEQKTIKEF